MDGKYPAEKSLKARRICYNDEVPVVPRKLLVILALLSLLPLAIVMDYWGIIWHNAPLAAFYEVKGLDVSHHQGSIDWEKVAGTNKYSFVFIKATEGHDFIDDAFATNWQEAQSQGLLVGAYHFFSTRSTGAEQADYFMAVVPQVETALPPVIDIEVDLTKDPQQIRREVTTLAERLTNHYGKKPILYVTNGTYKTYVKGHFNDYHIWIREIISFPQIGEQEWTIWQYNNRGRVSGINTLVDINAFRGSSEDLKALTFRK